MKLLLDEMYSVVVAAQLRARGYDVVALNDPSYRHMAGADDADVYGAALAEERLLVTENVKDFRRLEAAALAAGEPHAELIFTTNRRFPRSKRATIGRLVLALDVLLRQPPDSAVTTIFLESPD